MILKTVFINTSSQKSEGAASMQKQDNLKGIMQTIISEGKYEISYIYTAYMQKKPFLISKK